MRTEELDYHLPKRLIAQQPLLDRSASRLMVLDRRSGQPPEHRLFRDLPSYLAPGDCLVLNRTKVIPARFFLRRATGGRIEGLFLTLSDSGDWQVMLKNASRLGPSETLTITSPHVRPSDTPRTSPALTVVRRLDGGIWLLRPLFGEDHLHILAEFGSTPLPPYIHRCADPQTEQTDRTRYQTVYAATPGSVAAPTAGLHFTDQLLRQITASGVRIARLTLHVGLATFKPITTETLHDHPMHAEHYELDADNARLINRTLEQGKRLIAVGTTSVRTLESVARAGRVHPASGSTSLFITPGYRFQVTGAMLTNFHLPRTTLLAMVSAFATKDRILDAYRLAVEAEYRFYSYGDAMLLL